MKERENNMDELLNYIKTEVGCEYISDLRKTRFRSKARFIIKKLEYRVEVEEVISLLKYIDTEL